MSGEEWQILRVVKGNSVVTNIRYKKSEEKRRGIEGKVNENPGEHRNVYNFLV